MNADISLASIDPTTWTAIAGFGAVVVAFVGTVLIPLRNRHKVDEEEVERDSNVSMRDLNTAIARERDQLLKRLDELQARYDKSQQDTEERHKAEMAEMETRHKAEMSELEARYKNAQTIDRERIKDLEIQVQTLKDTLNPPPPKR
jgi:hypothetical protein